MVGRLGAMPHKGYRASYRRLSAAIDWSGRSLRISGSFPKIPGQRCRLGRAVPAPTCCRRMEHESLGHRLEPQDSPWSEDFEVTPHKSGERRAESTAPFRNPACLTKAPFGASPTPRLKYNDSTNLVVQLESPRLFMTIKSWPGRNVSSSERTHGTAFGGVKEIQGGLGEQSQAPLASLAAAAGRHTNPTARAADTSPFRGGRGASYRLS